MTRIKFIAAIIILAASQSCSAQSIVEPTELIKYESSSSFHHLMYMGSDSKYHYFRQRDKYNTDYRVLRDKLAWPSPGTYGEMNEFIVVWPGTIEKLLNND